MRQDGSEGRNRRGERAVEQRGIKTDRERNTEIYKRNDTETHSSAGRGGNWIQMGGELFGYG